MVNVPFNKLTKTRVNKSNSRGAFFKALVVALVMGVIGCVYPVAFAASSIIFSEPAFDVWKSVDEEMPELAIANHNYLYDINGKQFAELWVEDRIDLNSLDQVSDYAKKGLIDTEDKRFYSHKGFDLRSTVRAVVTGYGGASGITQQLVKNLNFYNILNKNNNKDKAVEQSYARKIRELKTAIQYEQEHSKDEILLTYFNTVSFGSPNIYGIETASKYFFDKPAKDLTLAEASALVGSVQNPSVYNFEKPEAKEDWRGRQKIVLSRMVAEGDITQAEADEAYNTELTFVFKSTSNGNCYSSSYPEYCKYTVDEMLENPALGETREERETMWARGGLHINTYLDPEAMDVSNRIVKDGYGVKNRVVAPTAIVQPGTGGVLAFAQNRDWGDGEGKTTILTPTVATGEGSVYKIFTLAAALNKGMDEKDLTFSSDCPLRPGSNYDSPPGGFRNSNSCQLQGGTLDYKRATAYSSNTWYVTLEMKIGVEAVKDFSRSVGLAAPDNISNRSLSYTLGTVGNSPIKVAAAAATFANKGVYCPATPVKSIKNNDGSDFVASDSYNPQTQACRAVMSPHDAGIVLKAMRANISGEIPGAFGLKSNIPGHDTGGKSGTNEGYNTSWVQVSSQYSIYTNAYDMDKPSRGIQGTYFRGRARAWHDNTAETTANDILRKLLSNKPNVPLDFDSTNDNFIPTPVDESGFFTVPSVIGMSAGQAVGVFENIGIPVKVSRIPKQLPANYVDNETIVEQSIPAGEKLSKGTRKEIILYIGKKG